MAGNLNSRLSYLITIVKKSPPQNFVKKTLAGACKEELHRKRRIENKVALPATTISPL